MVVPGFVKGNVYISLILRSGLFFGTGLLFVLGFFLNGSEQPFIDAQKWWPFQAIIANICTFFILRSYLKAEKLTFKSLFQSQKRSIPNQIKEYIFLILLGGVVGAVPLYFFSYLFIGSIIPPEIHFHALPFVAALIALVLFPITNAIVETPIYLGYALPRLLKMKGNKFTAIVLVGLALAFQHVFLPIVFDFHYVLWRLFSLLPLALILGLVYTKANRLLPIVIVHFLMDLQLVLQMFLNSIK